MKKILLLIIGVLVMGNGRALAHGGGTLQMGREPAGPYLVSVWTEPAAPQAGAALHVTVGVIDPVDDTAVLDADVQIQVIQNGQIILTSPATTENAANKLFYETDFTLAEDGRFDFTIQVNGPLGSGEAGFSLTAARDDPGINPIVGGIVGIFLGALVGGLAFRLIRRQKKR